MYLIGFFIAISLLLLLHTSTISFEMATWVTLVMNVISFLSFIVKERKGKLVCFEFFFSFSFLIVIYTYFFLRDSYLGYTISNILRSIHSEVSLVKGTVVSTILYQLFLLGATIAGRKEVKRKTYSYHHSKVIEYVIAFIAIVLFLLFLTNNYKILLTAKMGGSSTGAYTFVMWLNIVIILWLVVAFLKSKVKGYNNLHVVWANNALLCGVYIFLIIVYFVSGHRHFGIGLALAALFLYDHCIKKISNKIILVVGVVGYVAMAAVGLIRSGEYVDIGAMGAVEFLRDFISASLATPFFVEYADTTGITYGSNYLLQVTSIIPFLSGFIVSAGFQAAPASYEVFTNTILDDVYTGLGTSLVGDVFYSFGFLGAIILFYLLGYLSSRLYLRLNSDSSQSPYVIICYTVFMSSSFFMARNDMFSYVRTMGLLCITYYLLSHILKQRI